MKKVVITGSTSMIGINLIQYILEEDIEVLAIIRKNSTKKELLPKNDKIKIIECNLNELGNLNIDENNYDVFIHLAWEGTFGNDRNNVDIQNLNVKYTLDAVKLAKKLGCKKFIGAGSQAEYGRVSGKLNSDTPANPDTAYGIAKLCAGKLSNILASQIGIEHIWTRILSVYGPYDNENTMVMSSIREMIKNVKSPEYTKAEQMWDYLYVQDIAKAIYLIGEKGKNNSVYCIGSGKQRPLYTYIEEIKNQINKNIKLNLGAKEYSKNQVMNLCADITKLTEDTGFIPEIDFEDGIKRTINWYRMKNREEVQ